MWKTQKSGIQTSMQRKYTFDPPAEALDIAVRLQKAGHQTLFCGGAVRDMLLGVQPKDYDIATSATPDEVEKLFLHTVPVGKAFGVMLVQGGDGGQYEVATFRTDLGYADGRRPDAIRFSSAEEDAKRRDFTINALFYDPFGKKIVDYVGGTDDIKAKRLRTVGDPRERFAEDKLRLLRAVRFAARTGFAVEARTWESVCAAAPDVAKVAPERIAAELEAMLTGGYSFAAFRLLKDAGLLRHVLPELERTEGVEQPPDFHPEGDVWLHTLLLLKLLDMAFKNEFPPPEPAEAAAVDVRRGMHEGEFSPEDYSLGARECWAAFDPFWRTTLAWSALLHDIGKPDTLTREDRIRFNEHDKLGAEMAVAVLERLRRPRRVIDAAHDLIRRHIHFSTLRKMRKSKLRRWLASPSFPAHLELHRLDCLSSHRMLANWYFGIQAWREEKARPPEPEPLLRGGDLIALGLRPGPAIGKILRAVEDARLEGTVKDREEALALAGRLAEKIGIG